MDLRLFAGLHDLFFRGPRLTVSDVLRDGRGEQEYILGHQRDLLPQGFPVPFLNWSAKDPVFSARLFHRIHRMRKIVLFPPPDSPTNAMFSPFLQKT